MSRPTCFGHTFGRLGAVAILALAGLACGSGDGSNGDQTGPVVFVDAPEGWLDDVDAFSERAEGVVEIDPEPGESLVAAVRVATPDRVFLDHRSAVTAVVPLADGRVASADNDGRVLLWEPDDPTAEVELFQGHQGSVTSLAALPDGRLVSGGFEGTVKVWDPDDPGEVSAVYEGHFLDGKPQSITALAVLPDGRVISAGFERAIHIWNPDDLEQPILVYTGHVLVGGGDETVRKIVALGENRALSIRSDGHLHLWALEPEPTAISTVVFDNPLTSIAVSNDRIVLGSDGAITVSATAPLTPVGIYDGVTARGGDVVRALVSSAASLADGRMATGAVNAKVTVWDPENQSATDVVYEAHGEWISAVAQLPDGRMVTASAGEAPAVHVWSLPDLDEDG